MLKVRWQSKKITWNQHYTLRSMISRKININFCKITTLSSFTKESLLSPKNFFSWNRFINYVGFTNISLSILKIRTINLLFIIKVAPIAWWLRPLSCGICWLNYQPWWAPQFDSLIYGGQPCHLQPQFWGAQFAHQIPRVEIWLQKSKWYINGINDGSHSVEIS